MEELDVYPESQLQNDIIAEHRNKYFRGGSWGRSIDLLQHLCQYSSQTILVKGNSGLGKTTLMQAFLEEPAGIFKSCGLPAKTVWDTASILQQVATGFGIAWQQYPTFNSDDLTTAAAADDKIWVLLVDAAHLLTIDALALLFSLSRLSCNEDHNGTDYGYGNTAAKRIHVVLFGTQELEVKLTAAGLLPGAADSCYTIELEPLSAAELESYLQHKWHLVGNTIPLPFDQKTIKKMYRLSQGNPREIERLAVSALAGEEMSNNKGLFAISEIKYPVLVGVAIFSALLCWLIFFLGAQTSESSTDLGTSLNANAETSVSLPMAKERITSDTLQVASQASAATNSVDQDNQNVTKQVPEQAVAVKAPASSKLAELREAVAAARKREGEAKTVKQAKENVANSETLAVTLAAAIAEKEGAADLAITTTASTAEPANSVTAIESEPIISTPATDFKPAAEVAAGAALVQAPAPTATKAETLASAAAKTTAAEQAILAMPGKHYTLQLLGANKETGIEKLVKDYKLAGKAYHYHTQLNGKDWYVLVYGNYASPAAAKQAVQELPPAVQKLLQAQQAKPWAKSIASIHSEIEKR